MQPYRAAAVVLAAGLCLPLMAQQQEPPAGEPAPIFVESVDVSVVNVEVFVTDKRGNPIPGLTAADFELREDGQVMEITNFYAVEDSRVVLSGTGAASARAEEEDFQPPPAEERRLHLAVMVDNFNLRPAGRKRVLDDLAAYLADDLEPDARVMILTHDRGGLHPILPFTSDSAEIAVTVDRIRSMPADGIRQDSQRMDVYRTVKELLEQEEAAAVRIPGGDDPCSLAAPALEAAVRGYAQETHSQVRQTVNSLAVLAGSLASVPGRRAVLYVSDGLEQQAGVDLFQFIQEVCPQGQAFYRQSDRQFDASQLFWSLAEHANANEVTFYTLEALGPTTGSTSSVEFGELRFTPSTVADQMRVFNRQDPLLVMARETGGRAIFNANDFSTPLEEIDRDFSNYYSLGYTPEHSGDGRKHLVKVHLADPGSRYVVRHRQTYRDKGGQEKLAERTLGTLLWGFEDNPLGATLEVAGEAREEDGTYMVDVRIAIPFSSLALLPGDGVQQGRLRLVLTGRDERDHMLPIKHKEVEIRLPAEATPGEIEGDRVFTVGIELGAGRHDVAVGIRDEIAATASFLRHSFSVGDGPEPAGSGAAPR